uniref:NADH-ubiquinone oxidoreductase chain 2 n=1 Tax=Anolis neglectus TaxID=2653710 RepID=A0A5P8DI24_9SAUR|nr:NADH dehydrogenase subunit 2 [Anolis neglectus]QFP98588.1 NADH dehydrogenase subunit 2 [Anolis neglectus]
MSPLIYMIIISSLTTGTIITTSSHHWLLAWIGLEINTLAIIPIISMQHSPRSTEAATKYFLTQAAASAMILFSSMMNAWFTGTWNILQMTTNPANILLTIAITMKLGLAPLHFWLPEVLQGTSMTTALIILTWQKLAPISLILMTINNLPPKILIIMGLTSSIIGGWGGLNQTQTRKIMAYSSIAHLGWMMVIAPIMTNILIMNLMIYLLMTTTMLWSLILSKSKTIQNMSTTWTTSPTLTIISLLTLFSLGGLPPLTGFMPKWLILEELTTQALTMTATVMALSSLLSLFFYLRLGYMSTLTLSPNSPQTKYKWRFKPTTPTPLMNTMMPPTLFLLPMTPMIIF